ncbi:hypothetical protein ACMFMG_009015 [Clarireedia jacksonii]
MKIIIAGATGFVATEVIKQALSISAITSIVALARRETPAPQGVDPKADVTKLKSVVCDDFENYSQNMKEELAGAGACIWLLAILPSQSKKMPWEEVRKVCLDYTATGLSVISQLPRDSTSPFRFIYVSGSSAERDQTKKPMILGDYFLLRGQVETKVLEFAKDSKGAMEACIAKPGMIDGPGRGGLIQRSILNVGHGLIGFPKIDVKEVAAALLDQVLNGVEKDTLSNEDLIKIGQKVLSAQEKSS